MINRPFAGDGWNGVTLYFTLDFNPAYSLTLLSGFRGEAVLCLPSGSYTPFACKGNDQSEVTWSVRGINGAVDQNCVGSFGSLTVPLSDTASPSPQPTAGPTPRPTAISPGTRMPIIVFTEDELHSAIALNGATVWLGNDVQLTRTVRVLGTTLTIDGRGFFLDGQAKVRCITISGSARGTATVILQNLVVFNGTATYGGGLLIARGSAVSMVGCKVMANEARHGAGARIRGANVTIVGCSFIVNKSPSSSGGGIYLYTGAIVQLTDCVISVTKPNKALILQPHL